MCVFEILTWRVPIILELTVCACVSGGGRERGHVVDRAGSSAVVADGSAVGADGVWSGGDQRGGAEEGGALSGGGGAAAARAVVLADARRVLE